MGKTKKVPVFKVKFGHRVQSSLFKTTLICLGKVSNRRGMVAFYNESTHHIVLLAGSARVTDWGEGTAVEGALLLVPPE